LIDFRPILQINGLFLLILGVGMLFPALVDAAVGNPDWQVFAVTSGLVLFLGSLLFLSNSTKQKGLSIQQAFLLTVVTWIILPACGALPFIYSELSLSFTDAFFEAMSGITTTGSTVITGLDGAPPGLLLWRSILQWFGGVGIVVMGVAILPYLQVGGMQLFKVEAFDTMGSEIPRATQLSMVLSILYIAITLFCGISLWLAGMTPFEAVCHAFTTVATGGFSTSDGSVGYFDSMLIDYLISFFMVVGSLPFLLYLQMIRGETGILFQDSQVRMLLALFAVLIISLSLWLWLDGRYDMAQALRYTTFNVISVITGTGFSTTDYTLWGPVATPLFFFIMFIGGCTGSTSCGIKVFRFQVFFASTVTSLKRMLRPNGIYIPKFNGKPISSEVAGSVASYLFIFIVSFVVLTFGVTLTGVNFTTAASGVGTALANVGPGVGALIGPAGNFQNLPDVAKWFLTFAMLIGRLELFAVMVLFMPQFWRN
tara:strand:- start:1912 stop:3360 length:1449 start_codon:yes stop_codon:yes gene_type:complete